MQNSDLLFKPDISRDEIAGLPEGHFTGEIFHVDNYPVLKEIIPSLMKEPVLGFDTETRPSFKKGKIYQVALLQLCTSNHAYLFRVNKMGLPDELIRILEDPAVVKAGIAIRDDIKNLRKKKEFNPAGFIELQSYVKDYGIADNGLRKLAGNILGIRVSKREQTSNWENDVLTKSQLVYAATDAWVCYEIFRKLNHIKKLSDDTDQNYTKVR